jgi:hypothetical protein
MSETLTPQSPRWDEFADALSDALTVSTNPHRWHCDGDEGQAVPGRAHRCAKQVMTDMGNIDIDASLNFFKAHGGYCDCEILFNVNP